MIKMLLRIGVLSLLFLLGGFSHTHAYSLQNSSFHSSVTNTAQKQVVDFVAVPHDALTFSYVVAGTSLEKSNLDALEDFIEDEDETELLPYKKHTETSAYFVAHYRSQSTEADYSHLVKSLQRSSHFSFPSSTNKYLLFCVFRI